MPNATRKIEQQQASEHLIEQDCDVAAIGSIKPLPNMPTDWGTDKAIASVSLNLKGEFSREIASRLQRSLIDGASAFLPVLAVTLSKFAETPTVEARFQSNCAPAIVPYNFDELKNYAALKAHTENTLSNLHAETGSGKATELVASVLNENNGKNICFHFRHAADDLTVEVTTEDNILFDAWLKSFFECLEFYGTQLLSSPDDPLASVKLVPPRQWDNIRQVNNTEREFPRESDLISVLLQQVARHPDADALVSGEKTQTYAQLMGQARSIAQWLVSVCDPADRAVGVVVDRNENAYATYIGILMAGGYYVPVSPKNPASRIEQIFQDAEVCTSIILDAGEDLAIEAHPFETIALNPSAQFEPRKRSPESIAYAIYTSGSTGKPKGVLVTDRNVLRFAVNATHISWNSTDRVGAISSHGFDASTFEIWSTLLNGVPIICLGHQAITDLAVLENMLRDERVTVMVITSALLTHIVSSRIEALSPLRYLIYGGELTAIETIRRLRKHHPQIELIHAYGPTENTVLSTVHQVTDVIPDRIPIGRPLANSSAWVVDNEWRPLPIGARGMLVVSGDGVTKGYINRPEATEKHFVSMPEHLRSRDDERGYITGDIARWNSEYALEFLGRADNQIKIRGFRIELDEIRATLTGLPNVIDAEVVPVSAEHGGIIALEAFVVIEEGTTTDAVRSRLGEVLPDYMIPRTFYKIDGLPFNSSGKVDRKALASLRSTIPSSSETDARNDMDRRLVQIWKKLFGVEELSIDDSYTSLGGHSMMMLEMADMVFHEFNLDIALTDLVTLNTIRQISDSLAQQQTKLAATRP